MADLDRAMSTTPPGEEPPTSRKPRALGSNSKEYRDALVEAGFKKVRKPRKPRALGSKSKEYDAFEKAVFERVRKPSKAAKSRAVGKHKELAMGYGKKPKAAKQRRGRKDTTLGLAEALSLAGSLHRTDLPIFQQLTEIIGARGGPSRKRLLAAIGKVF